MRLLGLLFSIAAVIALSSCGTATAPTGSGSGQSSGGKSGDFKAALVTPGAINDGGWSEGAYNGLKKIEAEFGAKISNAVVNNSKDGIDALREFAKQENNLIIAHGGEYFDPQTFEIAKARPKSTFLVSASEAAHDNVVGVRFLLEDACYILGQIAGAMSKSGKLGCVGPKEHPVIASTFHTFEQGAKSVRADIEVRVVWTDSWTDVARAKERTLILIEQGADFVFHNVNDGAPGVFEAVQQKKDKGVLCFGANADQNSKADDVILASAVLDIPGVFLNLAKKVKDGSFDRKPQFFGMPDGFVWVSYNKKLENRIPADVKKRADETAEKIKKRELEVPRLKLK
jgi:basic membrane protein A and related proteins